MKTVGIVLSVLLCGCTANGPAFQPAAVEAADKALIYVYRPSTYLFLTTLDVPFLYLDGNQLARLRIGGYTRLEVDEGPHMISFKESEMGFPDDTIAEIGLVAVPGDTYYVRFSMEIDHWAAGFWRPRIVPMATVAIVPRELGLQEIGETRLIAIE